MKSIFAAVVLVSLMAVVHCTVVPTYAEIQCASEAAVARGNEFLEVCGDVIMSNDTVRF